VASIGWRISVADVRKGRRYYPAKAQFSSVRCFVYFLTCELWESLLSDKYLKKEYISDVSIEF
jgi:hypothetical protein